MAQLYFYYSAMNAGKSTSLLQSAYNYKERGMRAEIFTAALDDRFGIGKVASRIGLEASAHLFNETSELFEQIQNLGESGKIDCIFIDEAQFLSKTQVQQLVNVVDDLDVPVLAYGLRTDFLGEAFEGSRYLMAWADKLVELKTVCHCGRKATFVVRLDSQGRAAKEGAQVEVGGNDRYESVCRKHFKEVVW
ncbi:MAG: thymidine kinase [Paraglaciecola sp.]|jgi:thymidine kinase